MSGNFITTKERPGSLSFGNLLSVLLLFLTTLAVSGQEVKTMDKVVIGDFRYILHTVQKKETLYSISKRYECTQEEVLASNKEITGIIKRGMILKIPDHTYQKPHAAKIDGSRFMQHLVVSGDNYYQLKLKYGTEEEELLKYNPDLREGLKAGMTILIPKKSGKEIILPQIPEKDSPKEFSAPAKSQGPGKTWNVGLFLPISSVVADSLKTSSRTPSFLAFYQGALMAAEYLSKVGTKVKLYVYDTEKLASTIETVVRKPEFLSFDLLIGPVYPDMQNLVSELSAKNRIPMVSPLVPDDKLGKTNPCYFEINPVRRIRMEATANYIMKQFPKDKIIFLEDENGSSETKLIHEQLNNKSVSNSQLQSYNLWAKGLEGLETLMQAEKPNILVMAEMNEVKVSIAMNRLALLSKRFPIILVGVQEFTRMQSIEIENLHGVNLHILTTSFVDYSRPDVLTFVENFKAEFGTEPSLFAFQGFDVTTCFLQSLQRTGNLTRGMPADCNSGLLHAAYHFTKVSDFGGYTNDSFTVVEYTNTFEVKSLGIIQHPE